MNTELTRTLQGEETPDAYAERPKFNLQDAVHDFWRDHRIAIQIAGLMIAWSVTLCSITEAWTRKVVTKEVTLQVQSEMRHGFQQYLEQMEQDEKAAQFLTGEASRQAAIDEMIMPIAEHIAGLRMDRHVTVDGVKTYIWGVDFTRLDSGKYGSTIQQVLDGNVEAYKKGHAVRNEDKEIARELVTAYMNGERPDRWTPDLEFAEINADGSVTARSKLKTDSTTKFWRYE